MENKMKLIVIFLLISKVGLSAFSSGTYACGNAVYILKPNKKTKVLYLNKVKHRGYWTDEDDAAKVYDESFNYRIIEEKSGKFTINPERLPVKCKKIDENKINQYYSTLQSNYKLEAEKNKLDAALLSQEKTKTELENIDAKKKIELKKIEEEQKARELKIRLAEKNREIEKETLAKRAEMEKNILEKEKADAKKAELANLEKKKVESNIKRSKTKFARNQKRKLRHKQKELYLYLENFEKKYQFTKLMTTKKISDEALDAFFDMMDMFETEFPDMSPSTCGVYYDQIKDNFDKIYGSTNVNMGLAAGTLGLDANIYSCIRKNIKNMKVPK